MGTLNGVKTFVMIVVNDDVDLTKMPTATDSVLLGPNKAEHREFDNTLKGVQAVCRKIAQDVLTDDKVSRIFLPSYQSGTLNQITKGLAKCGPKGGMAVTLPPSAFTKLMGDEELVRIFNASCEVKAIVAETAGKLVERKNNQP